jgi:hypothetical protein
VNSVASLAAAVTANANGNYALAASYDASVDHTYKKDPITPVFGGNFEGLGNAISNVSIRFVPPEESNVGFFNTIGASASVSNFRLRNITISLPHGQSSHALVGGLTGESLGSMYGDDVSGTVRARNDVGGLGGLIGAGSGSIAHCSSTANVIAPYSFSGEGGGLAGEFGGTIDDSFATGDVRGAAGAFDLGGLVGYFAGPTGRISHSHASGGVSAIFFSGNLGGLVGWALGAIADSYAAGDLKGGGGGGSDAGGLVGTTNSSIDRSFATGSVRGTGLGLGGGLAGAAGNAASIANSYATGAVVLAPGGSGGLVGNSLTTTSFLSSYAAGRVVEQGPFSGGGFICGFSVFANNYWNTITSGATYGECGNSNVSGVTGLTTTQLQSGLPAGFDPKIWAQDRRINRGFPYLIANPPPQ